MPSAMHLFDSQTPPKGVVLFDVDPRVVILGRVLASALTQSSDYNALFKLFQNETELRKVIKDIIAKEQNPRIQQQLTGLEEDQIVISIKDDGFDMLRGRYDQYLDGVTLTANKYIKRSLEMYFTQWKQLAEDGNLSSFWQMLQTAVSRTPWHCRIFELPTTLCI